MILKSDNEVGISGYGAYIPIYRLPTTEVARIWRGGGSGLNKEKSVAYIDEDSATMAVEASLNAVKMANVKELGAIFVGTESKPYAVKPTSTIVAQALGQHEVLASDLEFACKAATEAIHIITGLIGSGMISNGLAIGVDTAQGRPGDELEYTAASGAAAFVLTKRNDDCVAFIEGGKSYVTDTCDFWRESYDIYPRHLHRFTGEPAYFHHIEMSVKLLLKELGLSPQDFKYAVFHQPNPRFPVEVAQRLGFKFTQIEAGLLNPLIGNTYSASSILGLVAILDEAQPGDRILLASFGSGAGSDAISILVSDSIKEKRGLVPSLKSMISSNEKIDYGMYVKFRGKLHK